MADVVVGVGRRATCGPAVRWASTEAAARGLHLTLVHAWRTPVDVAVDLGPDALPGLCAPATSRAVPARPVAALLATDPELLVLGGQREPTHLSRTTRACLNRATCPVVIVRNLPRRQTGRIVVGMCGSAAARRALEWAALEARLRCAELLVVHAWQVHPTRAKEFLFPSRAVPAQQAAALDRLRRWVDALPRGTDVQVLAVHAPPLDGILDSSANADLLVLGRSRRSRIAALLNPALDNDLSTLASCPIAVIPEHHLPAGARTGPGSDAP